MTSFSGDERKKRDSLAYLNTMHMASRFKHKVQQSRPANFTVLIDTQAHAFYIDALVLPHFPLSLAVNQSNPSSRPLPVSALHATICHCRPLRLVRSNPSLICAAFIHPRTSCLFASTRREASASCSSEASLCSSEEARGRRSRSVESITRMTALWR